MNVPKLRFKEFDGEWEERKLDSFVTFYSGLTYSPDDIVKEKGTLVLRSSNVQFGSIVNADNVYVNPSVVNSEDVLEGDIIVVVRNGSRNLIGKHAQVKRAMPNTVIGAFMTGIRSKVPNFLNVLLDTKQFQKEINKNLGATINQITTGSFKKMSFLVSENIKEQEKIGNFFEILDKKIQLQQQKIDLLQEQKKGYMQKIFNRELRFKDEKGNIYPEWKEGILEDVLFLKLREVPKPKTSYIRLGLRSHAKGTFHQLVTNPEEVSMDKLYVVKKGDLVINITFAWEQALAIAESNDEDKLVSHRFPTYSFKENQYNQFYKYYLTTKYFKYALGNASPGGAGRNRVLNKKDFLKIKLSYPCFKEQSIIADFLDKLDCKVFTELKKLELLQKQKQGFMQQMFI